LAALHDLNSLAMTKSLTKPFVIVILNNNGGGIFNFLPIAERKDIFEKFFGTPHNFKFEKVAKALGVKYSFLSSRGAFTRAYRNAFQHKGTTILEIRTHRKANREIHERLQRIVSVYLKMILHGITRLNNKSPKRLYRSSAEVIRKNFKIIPEEIMAPLSEAQDFMRTNEMHKR